MKKLAITALFTLLAGCTTPLERLADKCFAFNGSVKGSQAGEAVAFECNRDASFTGTTRASR